MAIIRLRSIHEAVGKGMLIELANDYRTSRTVRAWLPGQTAGAIAISSAAFSQHVQQGSTSETQSRMEALCVSLSKVLGIGGKPSKPGLEFRLPGAGARPADRPLKLEWYAPSNYWVIMLSDEQLQSVAAPA